MPHSDSRPPPADDPAAKQPPRKRLHIQPQPNDFTCGPTCLHAVYEYYDDPITLPEVIDSVQMLDGGGTYLVFLACHALRRGYDVIMYPYNLQVFDPTWFTTPEIDIAAKLKLQLEAKYTPELERATRGYLDFLALGGRLRYQELRTTLIRKYLNRNIPLLTGLSATYLYGCARERPAGPGRLVFDDVAGLPSGHFVVLSDYEVETRTVRVADPYRDNPLINKRYYAVETSRIISAIMLGTVTHDANLLVIRPQRRNTEHA